MKVIDKDSNFIFFLLHFFFLHIGWGISQKGVVTSHLRSLSNKEKKMLVNIEIFTSV